MNYFKCTVCDSKAIQWYAVYNSEKHSTRPSSLAGVSRRCEKHKLNEKPPSIMTGKFLTEEEITILSIMEDSPEKIFKEEE